MEKFNQEKDGVKRHLRITRLRLENWKNFISLDVPLQSRVFLVGPNAAGKSNFLDALRFLRDVVMPNSSFRAAVETAHRGGVAKIRNFAARKQPEVLVAVSVGDDEEPSLWKYELKFHDNKDNEPIIVQERVWHKNIIMEERPSKEEEEQDLTQTYIEQTKANKRYRELVDFFRSIGYLHVVPQIIRDPKRSGGYHDDPYGGDFLEQIAKTQIRERKKSLKVIQDALKSAVPQLAGLELYHDRVKGLPHIRGKFEHWRPQGTWQTEEQFSDGTLRLTGLLWSLLRMEGPLLLEEPELSLHPEIIRYLPQMFARIQSRTGWQVVISTHSADFLRDEGIGMDEVLLLMPGPEGGTLVKPAGAFKDVEALLNSGLCMAEAVMPKTGPKKAQQLALFGGI